ncbi:MAG TPA: sugar transferase [Candidatus Cybelea sp.]|nr:sugar transferase [Candidatus Cybelea sp.]
MQAAAIQRLIRYPARLASKLVAGDALMLTFSAAIAALILARVWQRSIDPADVAMSTLASGTVWIAIFAYVGFYRRTFAIAWHDEYYWVASVSTLAILPQMLLYTIQPQISTSRLLLLLTIPINVLVIGTFRASLRRWWERKGNLRQRIVFVGEPQEVQRADNQFGLDGKRDTMTIACAGWPPEYFDSWFWTAKTWHADRIVFTKLPPPATIKALGAAAARHGVRVAFATRENPSGAGEFSIEYLDGEPTLVPALPRGCSADAALPKAIIDFGFACIGLALLGPVMLATAIAVYLESGGPILFRQERIGLNGATFNILKFRSMRPDAEANGPVWATANDARTTKIGRFLRRTSLDELPQIFNVLRGEMSIVGPRPERPAFAERFRATSERYDDRHLVRPGITGLSHVYMSRDVDASAVNERLAYDLFYIEHWSPMMDLSIIFKTGCEVLLHRIAA